MGPLARGIPDNLNADHLDRFFFLVIVLTAVDFVAHVLYAKWYKCINVDKGVKEEEN